MDAEVTQASFAQDVLGGEVVRVGERRDFDDAGAFEDERQGGGDGFAHVALAPIGFAEPVADFAFAWFRFVVFVEAKAAYEHVVLFIGYYEHDVFARFYVFLRFVVPPFGIVFCVGIGHADKPFRDVPFVQEFDKARQVALFEGAEAQAGGFDTVHGGVYIFEHLIITLFTRFGEWARIARIYCQPIIFMNPC